ncbi:DUF4349 domain-containing protein [Kitasatospora atroaurantiaca]|uniref:Uncharacterized protein DUF4349 n=1 Tax=Kitasatospora atroaurantiaca TaxID=285545 RepID=A0A561EWM5_9ACTN|nr:DUF4349 domain-containing protein [Kitasatospora atroaurantiaca]TWE20016.1 uncharacterized protein DUF4349 [Kitasatospora atroaurantiaca]
MAHVRRRPALAVVGLIAAATVLVGGCSESSRSSSGADAAAAQAPRTVGDEKAAAAPAAPGAGAAKPGVGGPSAPPTAQARLIAYSAQLALQSKDVARTLTEARGLAGAGGGYVAGESVFGEKEGTGGPVSGRLTLKVPSASFQQTLDQLAGLGSVLSRSSQADDLTQQVVDVQSRLKSQQASVDRVRALMADAKSLSEIVSLESELSRREADLESLQRQQQELSARTSLSTITLEVRGEAVPPTQPTKEHRGFWGSIGGALSGGWHVLGAIVRALLVALAAVAPFVLVLGPLGWLAWRLRRLRSGRRLGETAEPIVPATPGVPAPRQAETE